MTKFQKISSVLKQILTFAVVVVPGMYFGCVGKPTEMGLAIVLGAIAAAFLNIDLFEEFAGGGFKAKLKKAVEEAYATIEHVKGIAAPIMTMSIANLTYSGRYSSLGISEKYQMLDEVSNGAKAIGLDKNHDINNAINVFHRTHTWDYYEIIASHFLETSRPIFDEMRSVMDRSTDNFITEEKLIEIIEVNHSHTVTQAEKEKIDDYVFYLSHRKPRRYVGNFI